MNIQPNLSSKQLYFICQQLSFALESGMTLPASLYLTAGEQPHGVRRKFLEELYQAIEQGRLMSEALKDTKMKYDSVFLEFVLAGEQNGTMQKALSQAAEYFQQQHKTKQLMVSALCYPMILLVLMIVAFGAMLLFVVPAVVDTYQNVNAELPTVTANLLMVGGWLKQNWLVLFSSFVLLFALFLLCIALLRDHIKVRRKMKRFVLWIPFVGTLYQTYWFIQIAQGLGLMLNSGMLLVNSLEAVAQIYHRSLFSEELTNLHRDIAIGRSWDYGIQQCSFVPRLASQMLIISEQSGTLPKALIQLQQYYQRQFQQRIQVMMHLLEPCMIILLGFGILFVAGSLFLPLVQSYQYLL